MQETFAKVAFTKSKAVMPRLDSELIFSSQESSKSWGMLMIAKRVQYYFGNKINSYTDYHTE